MAAATSSSSSSSSTVIVEIKEGLEPYVRSDSGTLTLHAIKDHMIGPDDALLLEWEGLTFMESPSTMVWGRAAPNLPTGLVVMPAPIPNEAIVYNASDDIARITAHMPLVVVRAGQREVPKPSLLPSIMKEKADACDAPYEKGVVSLHSRETFGLPAKTCLPVDSGIKITPPPGMEAVTVAKPSEGGLGVWGCDPGLLLVTNTGATEARLCLGQQLATCCFCSVESAPDFVVVNEEDFD